VAGRTIKNPHEQSVIELVLRLYKQNWSNREIIEELDRRGLKARVSNWQPTKIQRIIDRYAE